jgi:hypothetical protein
MTSAAFSLGKLYFDAARAKRSLGELRISVALHSVGVNVRHLSKLRTQFKDTDVRAIMLLEMVRAVEVGGVMRGAWQRRRLASHAP